jgi:RimJ/RimL family protein N-acetyltransferase
MNASDITIRRAAPGDAEQLVAHMRRLLEEPDGNNPLLLSEFTLTPDEQRDRLTEFAESDNSVFLVADCRGAIVGELTCKGNSRQALRHVARLGISVGKDHRRRGIGTRLMAEAMSWAANTGILRRIELNVYARNATAIRLYEKFGFIVEGRLRRRMCHHGEFLDDLAMARFL